MTTGSSAPKVAREPVFRWPASTQVTDSTRRLHSETDAAAAAATADPKKKETRLFEMQVSPWTYCGDALKFFCVCLFAFGLIACYFVAVCMIIGWAQKTITDYWLSQYK